MELVFKAAAISVVAAAAALAIKDSSKELSYALMSIATVVICISGLKAMDGIKELLTELVEGTGLSSAMFLPLIKCVGIALTVKVAASLCRDAGQSAVAAATEYIGAVAAVATALPLMTTMLRTLRELT